MDNRIEKVSLESMCHFFLQHSIQNTYVFNNVMIEGELGRMLMVLEEEYSLRDLEDSCLLSIIDQELSEGIYLEKYTPHELVNNIELSFVKILGFKPTNLYTFFINRINKVEQQTA